MVENPSVGGRAFKILTTAGKEGSGMAVMADGKLSNQRGEYSVI